MLKRKMSLVVVLAVLVACAGVANAELLDNGDFEVGLAGWAGYGCGSGSGSYYDAGLLASIVPTGGVGDSAYVEISPHREDIPGWWGWSQLWATGSNVVPVSAGDDVAVDFMAKIHNTLGGAVIPTGEVILRWLDGGGSWLSDTSIGVFDVTGDWAAKSYSGIAPAGAEQAVTLFYARSGESLGIDNVGVTIPEPITMGLLGLGGLMLRFRKK